MTEQRIYHCTNPEYLELLKWLKEVFRVMQGKRIFITISNEAKRSLPQNNYFHRVNKLITDFLRDQAKTQGNEEYYQINEESTKLWIRQKFLGYVEVKGELTLRKTSNMKTFEMNELWASLQLYFSKLGLDIPDPNE